MDPRLREDDAYSKVPRIAVAPKAANRVKYNCDSRGTKQRDRLAPSVRECRWLRPEANGSGFHVEINAMSDGEAFNTGNREGATIVDQVWLLGQPPLHSYIKFVQDRMVGVEGTNWAALIDEWRAANAYYATLAQSEAGIADAVQCHDLDSTLSALAAEVQAHARFRFTYDVVPTRLCLVELDHLVVRQTSIAQDLVDDLKSRLGTKPDAQTVFRFCLPLGTPDVPVQIQQVGASRFVFRSTSMDLRFHESLLLRPDQIKDYHTFGPIARVVGVVVGFGSNFLNVIRFGKRLLLHNGYHRACALRELGVTHAPCIVQDATHTAELAIVANQNVASNAGAYFDAARPPLLKDYFDSKIRKAVPTRKLERQIEVEIQLRTFSVTEQPT
jgi:hypothetical protein